MTWLPGYRGYVWMTAPRQGRRAAWMDTQIKVAMRVAMFWWTHT